MSPDRLTELVVGEAEAFASFVGEEKAVPVARLGQPP